MGEEVKENRFFKHPTAIIESDAIGEGTKIWHFVHVREKVKIGKNCTIGKSVYIDTEVEIGDNVKIENFASLYKGVKVEDEVFIGPAVTFTNDLYPRAFLWDESRIGYTKIQRGASIGANATVICGVTIGEYALVGAGSVVTKDVPPFGLVYGNPARLMGFICSCGSKLEKRVEENEERILYECGCGNKVEIKREWLM